MTTVAVRPQTRRGILSTNAENINLRVKKNDVINQINISTEGIQIAGENIELTGDTTVDGTFTLNGDAIINGSLTGAKLSSSTTITAGSGNNVGVLDGAHATYRIYAGNATPGSAPFRVTQAGALTATNATITGAITATSGSLSGLTVSGTLSIGAGGSIANAGGDYIINDVAIYTTLISSEEVGGGTLSVRSTSLDVVLDAARDVVLDANDDIEFVAVADVAFLNSGNILMSGLPTSDPAVSGALWNDSGTVKVSA